MNRFWIKAIILFLFFYSYGRAQLSERVFLVKQENQHLEEKSELLNKIKKLVPPHIRNHHQKPNGEVLLIDSIEVFFHSGQMAMIKCKYNNDNSIHSYKIYFDYLGHWTEDFLIEYLYDEIGRKFEILHKSRNGIEWQSYMKFLNKYDEQNNLITETTQIWSYKNWVNLFTYKYSYNSSNRLVLSEQLKWDSNHWIKHSKDTLIYNKNNQVVTKLWMKWKGEKWENYFKWNFDYEVKGRNDTTHSFLWNGIDWEKYAKLIFNWQNNYTWLTATVNFWQNHQWNEIERFTNYYNSADYLIETMYEYKKYDKWVPRDGYVGFINPDGFEIHFLAEGMIVYYGNPPIVGIDENKEENQLPTDFVLGQNFPNPFNPTTTIKYTIPLGVANLYTDKSGLAYSTDISLKIYNNLGQEITTLVNQPQSAGSYSVTWDASRQPSGIYFYTLRYSDKAITQKMVLLR